MGDLFLIGVLEGCLVDGGGGGVCLREPSTAVSLVVLGLLIERSCWTVAGLNNDIISHATGFTDLSNRCGRRRYFNKLQLTAPPPTVSWTLQYL
jgi:hypothetical protein